MYSCDICGGVTDIGNVECCRHCYGNPEIRSQYEAKLREKEKPAKRDPIGLRFDLIPGEVLKEVAAVLHKGAKRYGPNNWKKNRLDGADSPINHALKHLNYYTAGIPDDDGDDPKIHLAHALCNIIFELYYELNKEEYPNEKN